MYNHHWVVINNDYYASFESIYRFSLMGLWTFIWTCGMRASHSECGDMCIEILGCDFEEYDSWCKLQQMGAKGFKVHPKWGVG